MFIALFKFCQTAFKGFRLIFISEESTWTKSVKLKMTSKLTIEDLGICNVLPLDEEMCGRIFKRLVELGVNGIEDLPVVEERDLVNIIKPIHARKLLNYWRNNSAAPVAAQPGIVQELPPMPSTSNGSYNISVPFYSFVEEMPATPSTSQRNSNVNVPCNLQQIPATQSSSNGPQNINELVQQIPATQSSSNGPQNINELVHEMPSMPSTSNDSLNSLNLDQSALLDASWAYTFLIPWEDMPKRLGKCLKKKERVPPSLRRNMENVVKSGIAEQPDLPSTPVLVIHGERLFKASSYMIFVDRQLVLEGLTDFVNAIAYVFAYYYILNIQYASDISLTLEFIQRCFFGINPSSTRKKQKGKKTNNIPNHLLAFTTEISNFDFFSTNE